MALTREQTLNFIRILDKLNDTRVDSSYEDKLNGDQSELVRQLSLVSEEIGGLASELPDELVEAVSNAVNASKDNPFVTKAITDALEATNTQQSQQLQAIETQIIRVTYYEIIPAGTGTTPTRLTFPASASIVPGEMVDGRDVLISGVNGLEPTFISPKDANGDTIGVSFNVPNFEYTLSTVSPVNICIIYKLDVAFQNLKDLNLNRTLEGVVVLEAAQTGLQSQIDSLNDSINVFARLQGSNTTLRSINFHDDIDTQTIAPVEDYVLAWNANELVWEPRKRGGAIKSVNSVAPIEPSTAIVLTTDDISPANDKNYVSAANNAKLANISVTSAIDLDQIKSDTDTNNSKVSADGSVTTHSDITNAGSGEIITDVERTKLNNSVENGDNISSLNNDVGYVNASQASSNAPVQSVANKTGIVSLTSSDISDVGQTKKFTNQQSIDKVDLISVSQAVDLDQISTDVSANNSKVSADNSVTSHSDITSAGSGNIITNAERSKLNNSIESGDNVSELNNDAGYITSASAPVQTVNGESGIVSLDTDDIPEGVNKYSTNAEKAKLANITVNQLVNLDNIEANVTANNSKVSADGSVTTHSDVNSAGSGNIITDTERANLGSALQEVEDDTSPQLGGDLDLNGNQITNSQGPVVIQDQFIVEAGGQALPLRNVNFYGNGFDGRISLQSAPEGNPGLEMTTRGNNTRVLLRLEETGGGSGARLAIFSKNNGPLDSVSLVEAVYFEDSNIILSRNFNKTISNLRLPIDNRDAANKQYVDDTETSILNDINALIAAIVQADGSVATHSDVNLSGITTGDELRWNGSSFVASKSSNTVSYVEYGNTNTTKNLNNILTVFTDTVPIFGNLVRSKNSSDFTVNGGQDTLTINFDGFIEGWVNIYMRSNSQRPSVEMVILVNDSQETGVVSTGYIRSTGGHNHSSVLIPFYLPVSSGDEIKVSCRRGGNNGGVFMDGVNNSRIFIKRTGG